MCYKLKWKKKEQSNFYTPPVNKLSGKEAGIALVFLYAGGIRKGHGYAENRPPTWKQGGI